MKNIIKITKKSGIPLIGTMYFGIMDRSTNILEIRPTTLCNINCTFCSVAAGPKSTYNNDFVVEESYLVEELKKILDFKSTPMDIWINPQGDPTVYPDLVALIEDCRNLKNVKNIIIITNGMLLTKEKIDAYKKAGLTQISLSMNAFSSKKAKELADIPKYDIEKIRKVAKYAASQLKLVLTPVYLKNTNEDEIDSIIKFAKEINATITIQNFLHNRKGRNPVSQQSWKKFLNQMKDWEKKYNIELLKVGKIEKTKLLPKVAKKGQVIEVDIVMDGKFIDEKIAVFQGRNIVVYGAKRLGKAKIKIVRASHNLYFGKLIKGT